MYWKKIFDYLKQHKFSVGVTLVYAVLVIVLASWHEVWRDEARALNIVTESSSLVGLFKNLHNEGHPILWYLLLYWGYGLTHATVVLKIVNLLISIATIYIFLDKAPLLRWQKLLFIFSYFPIYEYSVISRNYMISALLLFLFCWLYRERFQKIISVSIVLFLLANTNAHSLIIAGALALGLGVEFIYLKSKKLFVDDQKKVYWSFAIMLSGLIVSALQIYPDKTSVAANVHAWTAASKVTSVVQALLVPGWSVIDLMREPMLGTLLILMIYFLYADLSYNKKYFLLLSFFVSVVCLEWFVQNIYYGGSRHLGFFFLLIVVVYWLSKTETREPGRYLSEILRIVRMVFYGIIFSFLVYYGLLLVPDESRAKFSASKDLAAYLQQHSEFKNALVVSEPDYIMESVFYYNDYFWHSNFIVRENRFGRKINFTTANKAELSLSELLSKTEELKQQWHRPLLIVLGEELKPDPTEATVIHRPYGYTFTYDSASVGDFKKRTQFLAAFGPAITDENYKVYLLK